MHVVLRIKSCKINHLWHANETRLSVAETIQTYSENSSAIAETLGNTRVDIVNNMLTRDHVLMTSSKQFLESDPVLHGDASKNIMRRILLSKYCALWSSTSESAMAACFVLPIYVVANDPRALETVFKPYQFKHQLNGQTDLLQYLSL